MTKIIEVQNLKKEYKIDDIFQMLKGNRKKVGIREASFDVSEGEIFSLIGVNGAGKTTLIKCIMGLIKQDSGTIKIFGKDKLHRKDFFHIGYLPEISYYPRDIKLKDLIKFYAELYEMDKTMQKKNIPDLLELLKLNGRTNDRLEKFSKGMLQRVGLAQALMNEPKLIFLDEPMSGLDPLGRKLVFDLMNMMKEKGSTIFFTTHILGDVEKVSDRISIIDNGELLETFNFNHKAKENDVFKIVIDKSANGFINKDESDEKKDKKARYIKKVEKTQLDNEINQIKNQGCKILEVEREKITLEEYFLNKISGGKA